MRLNRMQRALVLAMTVLLLGGLAGCGRSRIQLGWVASDQPGHFVASYTLFSGSEARAIGARAGETLIVDYDVTVDKGALTISVEGPDHRMLWMVSLDRVADGAVQLPVKQPGRHIIVIRGAETGGTLDLAWEIES